MKKILTIIALAVASLGAAAQDSTSNSASGSNSGANSASNATGNINASQSQSGSTSGASSGSVAGAAGNVIVFNPGTAGATATGAGGIPTTRVINERSGTDTNLQILSGSTRAEQILSGGVNSTQTNTDNIKYSGTIENRASGGQYNVLETRQSGTTTVKMAPAIAMSGPASGPCTGVSGGVGLSGPGWGVGFNGSSVMDDCRMRENTRVLGMGMQSLDGASNPQEKGEATVMFMDAMRNLAAYNNSIYSRASKDGK